MGSRKNKGKAEHSEQVEQPNGVEADAPSGTKVVDKRRFARLLGFGGESETDGQTADAVDAAPADGDGERLPSYVEELKQRAERAEAASKTEIEAARARLERYYEGRLASARADIIAGMLDVFDNLERALIVPAAVESPLYEGVSATREIFLRKLAELGVVPVPSVGEPFDPELHEAVDEVAVEDPELDGRVVTELQRGFRFGERLVRPARVRVGRAFVPAGGREE